MLWAEQALESNIEIVYIHLPSSPFLCPEPSTDGLESDSFVLKYI